MSGPALAPLAVVAAMDDELRRVLPLLDAVRTVRCGGRAFHAGTLHGVPVVVAQCGIGKVAAAATVAVLAACFAPRALLLTGVAGGLADAVRVGDAVIADELLQHDFDASPLFPRYVVPSAGRARFAADARLAGLVAAAAAACLDGALGDIERRAFGLGTPRVHRGLVVSGDRFVASAAESAALRRALPDALAVEMEGAAAAQVCADFGLPFAVVRVVSDRADDAAHVDFLRFTREVASVVTRAVVVAAVAALAGAG